MNGYVILFVGSIGIILYGIRAVREREFNVWPEKHHGSKAEFFGWIFITCGILAAIDVLRILFFKY